MSKENSTLYGGESVEVAEARKYTQANGLPDPYRAYMMQRKNASIRDMEWGFAFSTWWAIWQPYFHMRGRGTNGLCMARERDEGGYVPGNVYLTTNLGNLQDYHRHSDKAIEARRAAKEAREMRYARAGSASPGKNDSIRSQSAKIANHGSASTCNYRDYLLECEVWAL